MNELRASASPSIHVGQFSPISPATTEELSPVTDSTRSVREEGMDYWSEGKRTSPASPSMVRSVEKPDVEGESKAESAIPQNQLGHSIIAGERIVSLFMDGFERLCLAQISSTLLKEYSYNEIHNRRVALGITCAQCTPVQLEILRRAGAMPVSSRRCGMITKREAERLVKSFLEENLPPRLPDDFAFDVSHNCGWGGRGLFIPSRYNSSRAKCIRCVTCGVYLSPNKFIFHFHRDANSKYNHPDASNFNSWRRHIFLTAETPADDNLMHAWEDVKAMFNGGSRKRMPYPYKQSSSADTADGEVDSEPDYEKRCKMTGDQKPKSPDGPQFSPSPLPVAFYNSYSSTEMLKQPRFSLSFAYSQNRSPFSCSGSPVTNPWANTNENRYAPYEMLWAHHLGLKTTSHIGSGGTSTFQCQEYSQQNVTSLGPSVVSPIERQKHVEYGDVTCRSGSQRYYSAFTRVSERKNRLFHGHDSNAESRHVENCQLDLGDEAQDEVIDCSKSECEIDVTSGDDDNNNNNDVINDHDKNKTPDQTSSPLFEDDNTQAGTSSAKDIEYDEQVADEEESAQTPPDHPLIIDASLELPTSPEDHFEHLITDDDKDPQECNRADCIHDTQESLESKLGEERRARRKLEAEYLLLKETFDEHRRRSAAYKEMVQQQLAYLEETLQIENKGRLLIQQKLKEAHDILLSFTHNVLASKHHIDFSHRPGKDTETAE